MLLILGAWIFYFIILWFLGFGLVSFLERRFSLFLAKTISPFFYFWFGFLFLVFFLQFYVLFWPINDSAWLIVLALASLALLCSFREIKKLFRHLDKKRFFRRKNLAISFFLVVVGVVLLYSASKKVVWYDTNLYHLNAVKWIADYGTVPGLVNLRPRLGFNNSFFLFAALTDFWIYTNSASHIALSLLVGVLILELTFVAASTRYHSLVRAFSVLMLPFFIAKTWSSEVSSLSTDLSMEVFFTLFCLYLLMRKKINWVIFLPLATLITTMKPSGIMTLLISSYILVRVFLTSKLKLYLKSVLVSFGLSALLMTGFIARNVILSGWPFYPLPLAGIDVSWSAPKEEVVNLATTIKAWGRDPGKGYRWTVNTKFWSWFSLWVKKNKTVFTFKLFWVGCVFLIYTLYSNKLFELIRKKEEWALVLALSVLSLALFSYLAPLMRFGRLFFWIFFVIAISPVFTQILREKSGQFLVLIFLIYLIFGLRVFPPDIKEEPRFLDLRKEKSALVKAVPVSVANQGKVGFVWVPQKGDQCKNSELPCTPYPDRVKLRTLGDLSKGFLPPGE